MGDAVFEDPRLVAVYDAIEGDRHDLEVYVEIVAELGARSVLDIGCGTGTFACLLASRGIDVTAVDPARASIEFARARAGEGPSLIEVHTLRLWGHFEGDAQGYRPELADVSAHDPIPRYEQTLRAGGHLADAAVARIKDAAKERVEDAITYAKNSPVPDPASATSYVFA